MAGVRQEKFYLFIYRRLNLFGQFSVIPDERLRKEKFHILAFLRALIASFALSKGPNTSPFTKHRKYRTSRKRTSKKRSKSNPYRSKYEQEVCEALEKEGHGFKYEPCKIDYTIQAKYIPDLQLANGRYVEHKGYFAWDDRRKLERVLRSNPGLTSTFYFTGITPSGKEVNYTIQIGPKGLEYSTQLDGEFRKIG